MLDTYPTLKQHLQEGRIRATQDGVEWALKILAEGKANGSIMNVHYDDAVFILSRAVGALWLSIIQSTNFADLSTAEKVLFEDCYFCSNLSSLPANHKRLAKKKSLNGPVFEQLRELANELMPLVELVKSLKDKRIKGRIAKPQPIKPVNPDKIIKTCPCCFREIAVQRGTMAHHGYQRTKFMNTASCDGIRFRPLEESDEGLKWMIRKTSDALTNTKNQITGADQVTVIKTLTNGFKVTEVTKDMSNWEAAHKNWLANLISKERGLRRELDFLEKKLTEWKPQK